MSLEEFYNHIVKQIEKKVRIKDIMEWDGNDIPFTEASPMEFTEHDYYEYAILMVMKHTKEYYEGIITRYTWLKHIMAVFIMLNSFLQSER